MDRKKVKKIIGTTADTTAGVVGGLLRLGLKVVVSILLVAIITGLLFTCVFAYYIKTSVNPTLETDLEDYKVSLSSTIWFTDSDGVDKELVRLNTTKNRVWVDYENIPEDMEHALVAIEDKRFYEHKGVDWYRSTGAVIQMFFAMSNDFGGSTITQQLVKNVTGKDEGLVMRKLVEIFQALELEKTYDKSEIIEWYLNFVYFGNACYGIQTASQTYFGKDVWDLSLAECASIVGITNNPSKYDPFRDQMIYDADLDETKTCRQWNKYRQELILFEMYDQGYISYDEYQAAVAEELVFVRGENEGYKDAIYSWYEEAVIEAVHADLMEKLDLSSEAANDLLYFGGLQIYCCMDPDIQAVVDSVYEDVDRFPKGYYYTNQQLQSAIVLMDPYTGQVKALSGGVGEKTERFGTNRATQSKRSPGSSFKPVASYGPAFEYGLITQYTLVNDSPNIRLRGTWWYPTNSPNSYDDIITIRRAITLSKNTVAAQIIDKLTPQASYDFLTQRLGFTSLVPNDIAYSPMALGSLTEGVTVLEMAQAYCAFVNNGIFTKARLYTKVLGPDGEVIIDNQPKTNIAFSPNTAANMCSMLQNAVAAGTGGNAYFGGMAVAGKTGTTSANHDRYFCGFTPYYVAAVWTGYDMPAPMYVWGNPAAQIFKRVMQPIHAELP
ncbi:MAG: transglycosylase domain-containing protein, partial [Oscillospiraceae bacterium]|nr:transglycosylase domain-containing protein [Oscillospiraceae bacterium]